MICLMVTATSIAQTMKNAKIQHVPKCDCMAWQSWTLIEMHLDCVKKLHNSCIISRIVAWSFTHLWSLQHFLVNTRMCLAMSRMLAQCLLFLSQLRGCRKSGSGCLAFRRLKNLRSYLDHLRRALACLPKCRYDVPFGDVSCQRLKLVFAIHVLYWQLFALFLYYR